MGLYLNPDGTLSGSVSMMAASWDNVRGARFRNADSASCGCLPASSPLSSNRLKS